MTPSPPSLQIVANPKPLPPPFAATYFVHGPIREYQLHRTVPVGLLDKSEAKEHSCRVTTRVETENDASRLLCGNITSERVREHYTFYVYCFM